MVLPFTREQFLANFGRYNETVWPLQLVLAALALAGLVGLFAGGLRGCRFTFAVLGFLWLWMAFVYHAAFFSAINPAAWLFAALFAAGGIAFGWAVRAAAPAARPSRGLRAAAGWLLVAYALAGYPAAAHLAGQRYPELPTFGLPCPTTIFTLGVLLLIAAPPRRLFVVPLLWSAIGTMGAVQLGIPQDYGLTAAGAIALGFVLTRRRRGEAELQPFAGSDSANRAPRSTQAASSASAAVPSGDT
jgi:hypothetical protein